MTQTVTAKKAQLGNPQELGGKYTFASLYWNGKDYNGKRYFTVNTREELAGTSRQREHGWEVSYDGEGFSWKGYSPSFASVIEEKIVKLGWMK